MMNLRIHSIQLISNHKTAKQTNKQFLFFSFFLKINIFYVRVKNNTSLNFSIVLIDFSQLDRMIPYCVFVGRYIYIHERFFLVNQLN